MGVISRANTELQQTGLILTDLYYNIGDNMIYTRRNRVDHADPSCECEYEYVYHTSFNIFHSFQSKETGKSYIQTLYIEAREEQPVNNPYDLLYSKLKGLIGDHVDC